MNVVFLDRATFSPGIRFDATELGPCQWQEYATCAADELVGRAGDADVVITNKVAIGAAQFNSLPRLKLVAVAATGVDHIDLPAAQARSVAVCNVPTYANRSVAEHVLGVLLTLRRRLHDHLAAVRAGTWSTSPVFCVHAAPIRDLHDATLAIVGAGSLGRAVGDLASQLGMRVIFAERRGVSTLRPGRVAFDQALAMADAVSLHVPLTAATRGLIGARELRLMKPDAVLINTARGAVVDSAALLDALRAGRLAGAAIDVLEHEPPPADHPLLAADLPNLLLTPHIAWASLAAQQTLAGEVLANILAFVRGERRHRIV